MPAFVLCFSRKDNLLQFPFILAGLAGVGEWKRSCKGISEENRRLKEVQVSSIHRKTTEMQFDRQNGQLSKLFQEDIHSCQMFQEAINKSRSAVFALNQLE